METPDIIEFTQGGGAIPLVARFLNLLQKKDF